MRIFSMNLLHKYKGDFPPQTDLSIFGKCLVLSESYMMQNQNLSYSLSALRFSSPILSNVKTSSDR